MAGKHTLISSPTPWITAAEFVKRADPRTISDFISDNNLRQYQNTEGTIDTAALSADPNFQAILASASGQFESAVFVGDRYTPDDLTQLLNTTCNAQAYMFQIIARIARMDAMDRRLAEDPNMPVPPWYKQTLDELERLRTGANIFGFQEVGDAGLVQNQFMQDQPD